MRHPRPTLPALTVNRQFMVGDGKDSVHEFTQGTIATL